MLILGAVSGLSVEFLLTSLIVVLIPGTGVVYTVSSSISGGRRRGFIAAVACTLGVVPHMAASMIGLSGVMQAGATAFEVVRWAGVAYLVYMGASMIRDGGVLKLDDEDEAAPETSDARVLRDGVVLNLLNPKLTVFFFAFLPQFLDSAPSAFDPRLISLSGVFMVLTLGVFMVYAWASSAVREKVLSTPRILSAIQKTFGAMLVGFAARLAFSD